MGKEDTPSLVTETYGVWTIVYEPLGISRSRRLSDWLVFAKGVGERAVQLISYSLDAHVDEARVPLNEKASDAKLAEGLPITGQIRNLVRFLKDIYSLGPSLFAIQIASEVLSIFDTTANLYAANKLLENTSRCLDGGECRASSIMYALAFRISLAFVSNIYTQYM